MMSMELIRRLVALAAGVIMMSTAGTLYAYGAYSDAVKKQLGVSDDQSSMVIEIGNVGFCVAVLIGIVADYGGPKACAAIGGVLAGLGFLLFSFSMDKKIGHSWGALAAELAVVGQGSTFIYMAALVTYQNFPKRWHGVAIGTLDCMFGFSAAIFSAIYHATYGATSDAGQQNLSEFLRICAGVILGAGVLGVLLVNVWGPWEGAEDEDDDDSELVEEVSGWSSLASLRYWLLFAIFLIIQGVTLTYTDNVGSIATALHPNDKGKKNDTSFLLTTMTSVAGGVTRFLLGIAADRIYSAGHRVTLLLIGCGVMVVVAQIVLLVDLGNPAVALFTGVGFGGSWCIVPILTSHHFGKAAFGRNWGVLIAASAVGPWLFQPWQSHVYNVHKANGVSDCYGEHCYHNTWWLTFPIACLGLLLAIAYDVDTLQRSKTAKYARLDAQDACQEC